MVKKISSKIKLFQETRDNIKRVVWSLLSTKQRIGLSLLYVFILLFIEMIWRMMFEFLIAYMQIRDALVL
jgi:preprotein translocase subunit SecE